MHLGLGIRGMTVLRATQKLLDPFRRWMGWQAASQQTNASLTAMQPAHEQQARHALTTAGPKNF
eukprot:5592779-Amphidinium_carterae.1